MATNWADFVKELRETWVELKQDRFMKATIKVIATCFALYLVINLIVVAIKSAQDKPARFAIWFTNGIEAETVSVTKTKDSIIYIRDTSVNVGRDNFDIKGNPIINNKE